jgi:hypothetical protein
MSVLIVRILQDKSGDDGKRGDSGDLDDAMEVGFRLGGMGSGEGELGGFVLVPTGEDLVDDEKANGPVFRVLFQSGAEREFERVHYSQGVIEI